MVFLGYSFLSFPLSICHDLPFYLEFLTSPQPHSAIVFQRDHPPQPLLSLLVLKRGTQKICLCTLCTTFANHLLRWAKYSNDKPATEQCQGENRPKSSLVMLIFFLKKKGEWGDLNTELRARLIQTCNCSSNIFASPIIIFLIPYSYSDALFQIRGKNSTSRL